MDPSRHAEAAVPVPVDEDHAARQLHRVRDLAAHGRWEEALPICEALARSAPERSEVLEALADVRAGLDMWRPAAESYLDAITRDPHNPTLYRRLGDVQRRCGDVRGAAESYRRAVEVARAATACEPSPHPPLDGGAEAAEGYLELMKDCLTFLLWDASDGPVLELDVRRPVVTFARMLQRIAGWRRPQPASVREFGMDWPRRALTMVGRQRLDNVQVCVESVLRDEVPGDLIEAGVWRGGVTIFMRAILRAYGDAARRVWVADSFRGVSPPHPARYPADRAYDLSMWRSLAVSAEEVRQNFRRFHLLDERVEFLEGWFSDTLPAAPIQRLAVLRLDGDLYESTLDGLTHLYPKLSPGGFAIVDDYYSAPPCREAVDDFRRAHAIREELVQVDWSAAFWRKR